MRSSFPALLEKQVIQEVSFLAVFCNHLVIYLKWQFAYPPRGYGHTISHNNNTKNNNKFETSNKEDNNKFNILPLAVVRPLQLLMVVSTRMKETNYLGAPLVDPKIDQYNLSNIGIFEETLYYFEISITVYLIL